MAEQHGGSGNFASATLPLERIEDTRIVVVAPSWTDPKSGAVYVHRDLEEAVDPWENEAHISPTRADEAFGNVESWVSYVKVHNNGTAHLTWNSQGLHAVLDYPHGETPGRMQWLARQPFERSPEWRAWTAFASGQAHGQRAAIEFLEEHGEDIQDPAEAELMDILRTLRANVKSDGMSELRPDGTTSVAFTKDQHVSGKAGGTVDLPPTVTIGIPILVGHPDVWKLKLRLRVAIGEDAKLALRFVLQNRERAEEEAFADRVQAARALLGDGFTLLRAAG